MSTSAASSLKPSRFDLYVVYESPRDFPGKFVMRRWCVERGLLTPDADAKVADTLDGVRGFIPQGLYNIGRRGEDEAQIVEVWV